MEKKPARPDVFGSPATQHADRPEELEDESEMPEGVAVIDIASGRTISEEHVKEPEHPRPEPPKRTR